MIENIVYPAVDDYLQKLSILPDPVLAEMEALAEKTSFPIIGPQVGRLCYLLAKSIGARTVFEMGSGYGYSAWWFAKAVGPQGRVVHTDNSGARSEQARTFLSKSQLAERVKFELGDACEILERTTGTFDLVFIDLDKEAYPQALALARPRVRTGGLIVTDNVLWSGKVVGKATTPDVAAIQKYTEDAMAAPDLVTTIMPVRDGVAISLKVEPGSLP